MAVWSHVKVCARKLSVRAGLGTAYRLYARSVCDTKASLQLRYAACGAIQVLYVIAFATIALEKRGLEKMGVRKFLRRPINLGKEQYKEGQKT